MTRRAVIVGGGIGGMAAALSLAARRWDVQLFEQAPAFAEVGAGLQIGPNGLRVLRALGLEDEVLKHATRPDQVVLQDGFTGTRLGVVTMGATLQRRFGAPYLQIHRADLLQVLVDAAKGRGVTLSLGETIDPATLPDADLIVAADGVRSAIRQTIVPSVEPQFTGHIAWRALIPAKAVPGQMGNETRLFLGAGRHLVTYPLRSGRLLNLVAVQLDPEHTAEAWVQPGQKDDVAAAFEGWADAATAPISALGEVHKWGLYSHPELPRWHDGARIALLGDACHPMLPYMAQGAVMALEDAWALASALEDCVDVPSALARYESLRKPRATRVQKKAVANGQIYHAGPGPRRMVLRAGMGLLTAMPGNLLLRQFDWLYGYDPTGGLSS